MQIRAIVAEINLSDRGLTVAGTDCKSALSGVDVLTHTRGKGFGPRFQYVPGNLKLAGENFSLSDSYDLGGSFKIGIAEIEAGINFKEMGVDLKKGYNDLISLLRDGWGPFFRPIIPNNVGISQSTNNNWNKDR